MADKPSLEALADLPGQIVVPVDQRRLFQYVHEPRVVIGVGRRGEKRRRKKHAEKRRANAALASRGAPSRRLRN